MPTKISSLTVQNTNWENTQKMWVESKMSTVVGRVHLLDRESNRDIRDPMGGTYGDFNNTFEVINDCLDHWIPVL